MWSAIFIIYGVFCVLVALMKPPMIWKMKKLEIMAKMFGGDKGLQLFLIVWGTAAILVGVLVF